MSALEELVICPACERVTLVPHCKSPTCTWHHCRNHECDGMFDLAKNKGHYIGGGIKGERRIWRPPVAPP